MTKEIQAKILEDIMVIDDSQIFQLLCAQIIKVAGITENVISCLSAEEGLKYLSNGTTSKKKPPELIFLDINMPGMDGWDYLEEFKKLAEEIKSKIKIVILTSSILSEDKIKASSYKEVIDFVVKPLTIESTREIVEKHF